MAEEEVRKALLGITFDEYDPLVLDFLAERSYAFWENVSETTVERLREVLMLGVIGEWSDSTLEEEIVKIFDDVLVGDTPRARKIARTETTMAVNGAFQLGYEQTGLVRGKLWLTSEDARVRPTHAGCQAQGEVPLDKPFSNGLMYPGDPKGAVKEIVNCRCVLAPIVKTERELELEELAEEGG
jgi:hypothetical protein